MEISHRDGSIVNKIRTGLALAVILTGVSISTASAGPTGWGGGSCREISAYPALLSEPGVYCMSFKHIDFPLTSGALITIAADNVVLDMNGATIDGTPKGSTTSPTVGIRSARNYTNITVRNGTVKGFNYGISLEGHLGGPVGVRLSHGYLVENMRVINSRSTGIKVSGDDSEIRNNYVAHTGGSPDPAVSANAWGMFLSGAGMRVIDNDVAYTTVNTAHSGGTAYAMFMAGVNEVVAVNNRITEADYGIYRTNPDWGDYRDNVTVKVGVPYTGGTDIGNNN